MLFKPHVELGNSSFHESSQRGLNKRIQTALFLLFSLVIWVLTLSPFRVTTPAPIFNAPSSTLSTSAKSPYAFVTLLNLNPELDNKTHADGEDEYFVGTRVLAYQLLHAPNTCSNTSIPFIVLATPDITESKLDRLRKDGATVKVVERISESWLKPGLERWRDQMSKLRMLELTQYKKVLFMDADMIVTRRMDGIFTDPTTEPLSPNTKLVKEDEGPLPKSYIFSAQTYMEGRVHPYPPPAGDYFSGGFFLVQPSISMFHYYISLLKIEGRFNSNAMEQGLLNYAHRRDGPIPWTEIYYKWTTTWPSMKEYEAGAASLHEKWWDTKITLDLNLRKLWYIVRGEMEGYHRALEQGA
ncbi:hypothetical protein MMC28_001407 [Mycoblastus sanguinarius]|nr:hypothetical protein [Mycoblastus sanguinarius]